jgi:hypothetical protein
LRVTGSFTLFCLSADRDGNDFMGEFRILFCNSRNKEKSLKCRYCKFNLYNANDCIEYVKNGFPGYSGNVMCLNKIYNGIFPISIKNGMQK